MSCAARQARYAAKGWRMAAIERYLDHGGALCAGLEYVTLTLTPTLTLTLTLPRPRGLAVRGARVRETPLREPIGRVVSHLVIAPLMAHDGSVDGS